MSAHLHNQWNPWRELDRFQDEVNRLFTEGRWSTYRADAALPINVWVSEEEGAVLSALIPGVQADSLDISILGETLTLRGQRRATSLQEGETYHRQERVPGTFVRSVQLPFRVDSQKVVAHYERGVLELILPRAAEDKPRRIAVKAA